MKKTCDRIFSINSPGVYLLVSSWIRRFLLLLFAVYSNLECIIDFALFLLYSYLNFCNIWYLEYILSLILSGRPDGTSWGSIDNTQSKYFAKTSILNIAPNAARLFWGPIFLETPNPIKEQLAFEPFALLHTTWHRSKCFTNNQLWLMILNRRQFNS